MNPAVLDWIHQAGLGEISAVLPLGGGCINNGARLVTSRGPTLFLKSNPAAPADMFAREADGLRALNVPGAPRVPIPLLTGNDFLLTEDLAPAPPGSAFWTDFGRQLAILHQQVGERFGFEHDNYLGSTAQPNAWTEDGFQFFAEQRLAFQADLARRRELLSRVEQDAVHRLGARLPELIPLQPPSLIHGDLWSGNAISDAAGEPALIDPAAHYGWGEAELGMTMLFGGFPPAFYAAYEEQRPLESGWRQRLPIYNLYHLLNHLNLFGSSYLGQVRSILRDYV